MLIDSSSQRAREAEQRRRFLSRLGAAEATLPELVQYTENPYEGAESRIAGGLPLDDEPHVATWCEYVEQANEKGAFEVLRRYLVQLQFPIRVGISKDSHYLEATRRGVLPGNPEGLDLEDPDALTLELFPTVAGAVPVLATGCRTDFVTLVRALVHRNEPAEVPASMGACLVKGLNNWDRIARYRLKWEEQRGSATSELDWQEEFKLVASKKELYQDTLLLLSGGPYADVPAQDAGRSEAEWDAHSLAIRRAHECFHYLTWRLYGSIRSNLLDELVADLAGLLAADGTYQGDLALRLLGIGLDQSARMPDGARFELYRGDPPLSDQAVLPLLDMARAATRSLTHFIRELGDQRIRPGEHNFTKAQAALLLAPLELGLVGLAEPDASSRLASTFERLLTVVGGANEESWSFRTSATTEGIGECLYAFERMALEQGLSDRTRAKLGMVMDEVLTNVSRYAYDDSSPGDVTVNSKRTPRGNLCLQIVDAGRAFDPLYQPAPELTAMTGRKPGGLGIYLLRHLAASLRYERLEGSNVLTVELTD